MLTHCHCLSEETSVCPEVSPPRLDDCTRLRVAFIFSSLFLWMDSVRFLFTRKAKLPGKGLFSGNLEKCCEVWLEGSVSCSSG